MMDRDRDKDEVTPSLVLVSPDTSTTEITAYDDDDDPLILEDEPRLDWFALDCLQIMIMNAMINTLACWPMTKFLTVNG